MKFAIIRTHAVLTSCLFTGMCTMQDASNLVTGANTACTNAAAGLTIVSAADPALVNNVVQHNSTTVNRITAACTAIGAINAADENSAGALVPAK